MMNCIKLTVPLKNKKKQLQNKAAVKLSGVLGIEFQRHGKSG